MVKISAVRMLLSHWQNKSSDTKKLHILVILGVICKEYKKEMNSN
jgi:hypothetical protein